MRALLFKLYLWLRVPGLGLVGALKYPYDPLNSDSNPFEDARNEISYMAE